MIVLRWMLFCMNFYMWVCVDVVWCDMMDDDDGGGVGDYDVCVMMVMMIVMDVVIGV